MKKVWLLIVILLFTGCTKHNIIINDVIAITYNDNSIVNEDFTEIIDDISKIDFYCGKQTNNNYTNTLTITTNQNLYKFDISNNYYMEYQDNDKYCHTKDTKKVEELVNKMNNLIDKYSNISYFTIRSELDYEAKPEETFVKLDKSNNYIIINSIYPLYDFKINQVEKDSTDFKEISLLYSAESIDKKRNIIIRKEVLDNPDFKISFRNQYNYFVTILPFTNDNNEINFITDIKK